MKRVISMSVMVVSCLLQQGCYMFVDREGKYFASTKEAWSSRDREWSNLTRLEFNRKLEEWYNA